MDKRRPLVYLNHIHCVKAPHSVDQKAAIGWLMKALQRSERATPRALNLYERLLANTQIATRRSVLADFSHEQWEAMELWKPVQRLDGTWASWTSPPLEHRMQLFAKHAMDLTREAFADLSIPPAYLVEVSCTGYDAPYPSQKLLLEKGWHSQTRLLKLGHMGCYASVPALNMAGELLRAQAPEDERPVSIISSELCSLHLSPWATDPDQIVANILFADGTARMDLSRRPSPSSLALIDHAEALLPGTADCMTWILADSSFRMTLSRKVSTRISEVLAHEVDAFLAKNGLKRDDIQHFAVHPGGPLIIETVQRTLALDESAVAHSKAVLKAYGNMSSSTLPHIWSAMQQDPAVKSGSLIVSLAFGPGLSLIMNLLGKDL